MHDHRNSFENPITTVNLSLGTNWNSDSIPNWAMLEDEFAQLKADGIFISVAAGNSFGNFNAPGLSYPAASPHVVPVASHDDAGQMSDFSQRNQRVIAAPGENIVSTVPDHIFGASSKNEFMSASGTSMAAPYLAGSSVLMREAMEFAGYTNITQDTIYDHFRATAEEIWDSATSAHYKKLDLQAAMDALLQDDHGNKAVTATELGTLAAGDDFSGFIGRLDDVDAFRFTAAASGTLTLDASTTHDLQLEWGVKGAKGSANGDSFSFEVKAGKEYTIFLDSGDGLGHYDVNASYGDDAGQAYSDWGTLEDARIDNLQINGEQWFRFSTAREGLVTVQSNGHETDGNVTFEVYESNGKKVKTNVSYLRKPAEREYRRDFESDAGETFLVKVSGQSDNVDFRVVNLVGHDRRELRIFGTDQNDHYSVEVAKNSFEVSLNEMDYRFKRGKVRTLEIEGGGGQNELEFNGEDRTETVRIRANSATVEGHKYVMQSRDFAKTHYDGGGGMDSVRVYGTDGSDQLIGRATSVELRGDGFHNTVTSDGNLGPVRVYGYGGADTAEFFDSAQHERLYAHHNKATFKGESYEINSFHFETVSAHSSQGGDDRAYFYGTSADERFTASPEVAAMESGESTSSAHGFSFTRVLGSGGRDVAVLSGSNGEDRFRQDVLRTSISGQGYEHQLSQFTDIKAYGRGGADRAYMYDTAGDDLVTLQADRMSLEGSGITVVSEGFERNYAFSEQGGNDRVHLIDTEGDDRLRHRAGRSLMTGDGYYNLAMGFQTAVGISENGGVDRMYYQDTASHEDLVLRPDSGRMVSGDHVMESHGFARTYSRSENGGMDRVRLVGSAGLDYFHAYSTHSTMRGDGYYQFVAGFSEVIAESGGGSDKAYLYDTDGDDHVRATSDAVVMQSESFTHRAEDFARVYAFAENGGFDTAELYDSVGKDEFIGRSTYALMYGSGFRNLVSGFEQTRAHSVNGGQDTASLSGSEEADHATVDRDHTRLSGGGFDHQASGFYRNFVDTRGGNDTADMRDLETGQRVKAHTNQAAAYYDASVTTVKNMEYLQAFAATNHTPDADIRAVEYALETFGDWQ